MLGEQSIHYYFILFFNNIFFRQLQKQLESRVRLEQGRQPSPRPHDLQSQSSVTSHLSPSTVQVSGLVERERKSVCVFLCVWVWVCVWVGVYEREIVCM